LPPVPAQSHGDAGLAKTTHDIAVAPGAAAALREQVLDADSIGVALDGAINFSTGTRRRRVCPAFTL
jgi:hypothetical protein